MEEKPKIIIDDDDIEILDFDDDIVEESPELEEIIIEDVEPIQEQVILPIKESKDDFEPVVEYKEVVELPTIEEKHEELIKDETEIPVIEEQTPNKIEIENKEPISNTD